MHVHLLQRSHSPVEAATNHQVKRDKAKPVCCFYAAHVLTMLMVFDLTFGLNYYWKLQNIWMQGLVSHYCTY